MVNLQGLLILIVSTLTKYYNIIKRVYFKYRCFVKLISTFLFLLFSYTVSWRCKRDFLHPSMDKSFYVMFYIINKMKKILNHVRT